MQRTRRRFLVKRSLVMTLLGCTVAVLAGCVGQGGVDQISVEGLARGESVTLLDNGATAETFSANGVTSFPQLWLSLRTDQNDYNITVQSHTPGIVCAMSTNASGSLQYANITVTATCRAGTESALWSFGGPKDGQNPQAGLIMDTSGNLYGTTSQGGANGAGAVFEIPTSTNGYGPESVLWSFGAPGDGQNPQAALIMDSSGNLYGTTQYGGAYGYGAAFEIPKAASGYGPESVLWSFGAPGDGQYPKAGLIMDSSGNLYGVTYGGANAPGVVFEIPKTASGYGTESVLWSFGSPGDGQNPAAGLLMDSSGNLYGTTSSGGASAQGAVFEIPRTASGYGTESVLWSFGAPGDGQNPQAGLLMDNSGNLYGTTSRGGANGQGAVFEIPKTASGYGTESVLWSFGAMPDGQVPYAGLLMDGSGNLYGTTTNGGANGQGGVFEIPKTASGYGTESVLWSFGAMPDGQVPYAGLIMDSSGNVYGTTFKGGTHGKGAVFEIN